MRTQRAKKHEAGEGDGPEVHGVDRIATMELGESALGHLDQWTQHEKRTDQKTFS